MSGWRNGEWCRRALSFTMAVGVVNIAHTAAAQPDYLALGWSGPQLQCVESGPRNDDIVMELTWFAGAGGGPGPYQTEISILTAEHVTVDLFEPGSGITSAVLDWPDAHELIEFQPVTFHVTIHPSFGLTDPLDAGPMDAFVFLHCELDADDPACADASTFVYFDGAPTVYFIAPPETVSTCDPVDFAVIVWDAGATSFGSFLELRFDVDSDGHADTPWFGVSSGTPILGRLVLGQAAPYHVTVETRSYDEGPNVLLEYSTCGIRTASTTWDFDATGADCACFGDINDDGRVDTVDLTTLLFAWGTCAAPCPPTCPSDLNFDCEIDADDLVALLIAWGPCDVHRPNTIDTMVDLRVLEAPAARGGSTSLPQSPGWRVTTVPTLR